MSPALNDTYQIRPALVSDAHQLAELFSVAYRNSSHECKSAEYVQQCLSKSNCSWLVAVCGTHQVVACTAYQHHLWNASMELGWTITHPDYRNGGLSTQLVGAGVHHLSRRGDIAFGFGFSRSLTMYRLVSERVAPPFICTGHDGGLNIANGLREYHLATVASFAQVSVMSFRETVR